MIDPMKETVPEELILIAGRDAYPLLLARAARAQGVRRITAVAFKGETSREITRLADRTCWLHLGQFGALIEVLREMAPGVAVMAGQIRPGNIFRVRMDRPLFDLFRQLPVKTAHTVFGALIGEMEKTGVRILPASFFMQEYIPAAGLLTRRAPDEREQSDAALGRRVIKETSHLDIGQTVVVKEGIILAVEAFEGTDRALRRGGRLGGRGAVAVKVPKTGHDFRFDIPVIGQRTLRTLRKAKISCLALEEGGALMLERDALIAQADAMGLALVVMGKAE